MNYSFILYYLRNIVKGFHSSRPVLRRNWQTLVEDIEERERQVSVDLQVVGDGAVTADVMAEGLSGTPHLDDPVGMDPAQGADTQSKRPRSMPDVLTHRSPPSGS